MEEKQRFLGFVFGFKLFQVGFYAFIIPFLLSLFIRQNYYIERVIVLGGFLVPIGLTLIILFRGDIKEKKGYFSKLTDILIPWKFPIQKK